MATIGDALLAAMQHHQAGQFSTAEQIYRQILQVDPAQADVLNLLGVLCNQTGRPELGLDYIQQALRLKPQAAIFHYNEGLVYQALDRHAEAVASYRRAVELMPEHEKARNNLGLALASLGQPEQALSCLRQAIALRADYAEAHYNLANVLAEQRDLDQAADHYRAAIRLRPDWVEAHNNLGNALARQVKLEEARDAYQAVLRLRPDHAEAHNNLANILAELGTWEGALAHYGRAIELKPDYALAHWNRSLVWLTLGNFEQGWPAYEWRNQCPGLAPSTLLPAWDGSLLAGRRILLYPQGGLGDTLQYIRYARRVQHSGGRVIALCQPELAPLLRTCQGIDELVPLGSAPPAVDLQVSLLSLPAVFRTRLSDVPNHVPYLSAEAALVKRWREELRPIHGLKIGIAWQGSKRFQRDERRSLPLTTFAPLAKRAGVRLFSLQKGPGQEQLTGVEKSWQVLDLGSRLETFADTAAVLLNLDLVITVDSSVAHCAGSLGVPAWLLLWSPPEWRWLLEREDSPWYPSLRLFRQRRWGDWGEVFERIALELQRPAKTKESET